MTEVYLVRHAVAENRDAERWPDDSLRPLTAEGVERFVRAARGLRRLVPTVEILLSSPYLRAWQTATILQEQAGWPEPEACAALAASCPPETGLEVLRDRSEADSIALVGHEPYLSRLTSLLLSGDAGAVPLELKKGGVVAFASAGDPVSGRALLRWSASPKILRRLDLGPA